jgi:hypothetical protein
MLSVCRKTSTTSVEGTARAHLSVVIISLPLLGCVGTMDSIHLISGETQEKVECVVRVTRAGTSELITERMVQGRFSVSYLAAGPMPSKVDVAVYCGNSKVKEIRDIIPRRMPTIEFGKLPP